MRGEGGGSGRGRMGSLTLQPRRQRAGCGELGLPASEASSAARQLEGVGLGT